MNDNKDTIKIAILGLKASGKSTFLAVLNLALARVSSRWKISPIGSSIATLKTLQEEIFNSGFYPPTTLHEGRLEFRVEKESNMMGLDSGAKFVLIADDIPGEATKGKGSDDVLWHDFYDKSVRGCSAIIFLLDPDEIWRKDTTHPDDEDKDFYLPLFTTILAEINEQSGKNVYIAFCVTKLDKYLDPNGDFDKHGEFDNVEDYAEKILGQGTKSLIDYNFDRNHLRWLPISATGYVGSGKDRSSQFTIKHDQIEKIDRAALKKPKYLEPIGVAEAIEWALNSIAEDIEEKRIVGERSVMYAKFRQAIRRIIKF